MSNPVTKGKGKAIAFLRAHVGHQGTDCLWWPFGGCNGYGSFGYLGKQHYAHRFMCELAHGPAPSPDHEAAHSCGHGHRGCVNPRHLSWKTRSENQADRARHGTGNVWGGRGKITPEIAAQIRALKGKKTQREIAEMFGISRSNVSFIMTGKAWVRQRKGYHFKKDLGKFCARIRVARRDFYLGVFEREEDAAKAYEAATRMVREGRADQLTTYPV